MVALTHPLTLLHGGLCMHRFASVLLVLPFLFVTRIVSAQCGTDLHVTPSAGVASLSVELRGIQWGWVYKLDIDMGGEVILHREFPWDGGWICDIGGSFSGEHEFYCPGTYQIKVYEPGFEEEAATTSVTVAAPPEFHLFAFAGETDHDSYVATHWSSSQRPFTYSTVDWGDGSHETFTYALRGLYAGSPNHAYVADGKYTATVSHHYVGQYCSWEQTETVEVTIPNTTTPTDPVTWGRVKAMYRE